MQRHPHKGGIIFMPDQHAIWMKPCKTAGTSIMRVLNQHRFVCSKHSTEEWALILDSMDDNLTGWRLFSQCRHPLDRLASAFGYYHIEPERWFDADHTALMWENPGLVRHTIPQRYYTHDPNRKRVDYLLRVENIDSQWADFCNWLGIRLQKLPHVNKSTHQAWQDWHGTWKIKAMEMYCADMVALGYEA